MGSGPADEPMSNAEIESRIESIEKTETAVFGGMKLRYAYLSQRGYYPDGEYNSNICRTESTLQYLTFCTANVQC